MTSANRRQRRDPLRDAMPRALVDSRGTVYDHASGKRLHVRSASVRVVLAACPFRSILSRRWPPEVRDIWAPSRGCAVPIPDEILSAMAETLDGGFAILLLSDDRSTRDLAKQVLTGLLGASPGVVQ